MVTLLKVTYRLIDGYELTGISIFHIYDVYNEELSVSSQIWCLFIYFLVQHSYLIF